MIAGISASVPPDSNFAPCGQQWPSCRGNFPLPLWWFRNGVTWLALAVIVLAVFAEGTSEIIGAPVNAPSATDGNASEAMLRPRIRLNIDGKWHRRCALATSPGNWIDGRRYFVSTGTGHAAAPCFSSGTPITVPFCSP